MNKGLEAYKELKNVMLSSATKFTFQSLINCSDKNKELDNIIEKELKALEIIKEKNVSVELLRYWWKNDYKDKAILEKYNFMHYWKTITQEEYNLLKEVLL